MSDDEVSRPTKSTCHRTRARARSADVKADGGQSVAALGARYLYLRGAPCYAEVPGYKRGNFTYTQSVFTHSLHETRIDRSQPVLGIAMAEVRKP